MPKRGRPKGKGMADDLLVEEGLTMLKEGHANSIHDAAKKLAHRAQGNSPEAKVRRLGRKMSTALGEGW